MGLPCRCPGRVWEPIRKFTRISSRNIRSQSSQLAEPLWTDPGLKSENSVRELILHYKKKKRRWGMKCRTFSQNPCTRGKATIIGLVSTQDQLLVLFQFLFPSCIHVSSCHICYSCSCRPDPPFTPPKNNNNKQTNKQKRLKPQPFCFVT